VRQFALCTHISVPYISDQSFFGKSLGEILEFADKAFCGGEQLLSERVVLHILEDWQAKGQMYKSGPKQFHAIELES